MFRRTDCHYSLVHGKVVDSSRPREYYADTTDLLEGIDGRVYLDTQSPRVYIRGPEDERAADLGYKWLPDDDIFPFYELRSAAMNLHHSATPYDHDEMRHRVRAQLDTCIAQGVRHVVLGAFGCGAYCNPAARVASLYAEELAKVLDQFEVVVFSIFYPGYGPDNYTPFAAVLAQAGLVRPPPQFGHNTGDWQVVRNPRAAPMALTDPWETDPVRSQWRGQSSHWDGSIPRGAGIICLLPPPPFGPPPTPEAAPLVGGGAVNTSSRTAGA